MAGDREKDPNEIGALWLKEGKKGEYMTGEIEGVGSVVCFPIRSDNPKAPKWRVKKSQPREGGNDDRPRTRRDEGYEDSRHGEDRNYDNPF